MRKDPVAALKALGESWWEAEQARVAALQTHPDNGREGTWLVEDDRNSIEVEAGSAPEAWELVKDKYSWWAWTVEFLGRHE